MANITINNKRAFITTSKPRTLYIKKVIPGRNTFHAKVSVRINAAARAAAEFSLTSASSRQESRALPLDQRLKLGNVPFTPSFYPSRATMNRPPFWPCFGRNRVTIYKAYLFPLHESIQSEQRSAMANRVPVNVKGASRVNILAQMSLYNSLCFC